MTGISENLGGFSKLVHIFNTLLICVFVLDWAKYVPVCPSLCHLFGFLHYAYKHTPLLSEAALAFFYLLPFLKDCIFFSSGLLVTCRVAGLPACSRGPLSWKLARFSRRNLKNAAELLFPN